MCASLLFLTAAFFGGSLPDEQSGLERLERFDRNKLLPEGTQLLLVL